MEGDSYVKKRKGSRRQKMNSNAENWLGAFAKPRKRERRSWTFERLEDRYYFTASPLAGLAGLSTYGISNSTTEGQQLIDAFEQLWYAQATGNQGSQGGTQQLETNSIPTDPYLQYQWHLLNVGQVVNPFNTLQDLFGVPGQDINVVPAWDQGISGAGVTVAVVDTGVQLDHPDLIGNLVAGWDAVRNRAGGGVQNTSDVNAGHGTAVAGLIGAVANNGIGGSGVAFGATIFPIRFLGANVLTSENTFINAIAAGGAPIDIYNHSWGPASGRSVAGPTMNEFIALDQFRPARPQRTRCHSRVRRRQ